MARDTMLRLFVMVGYVAAVYGVVVYLLEALWPDMSMVSQAGLLLSAATISVLGVSLIDRRLVDALARSRDGGRTSPYDTFVELSGRLASAQTVETAMSNLARILAEGTGSRRATVWLFVEGRLVPATSWPSGPADDPAASVPELTARWDVDHVTVVRDSDGELGALTIATAPGRFLTPVDQRLVDDIGNSAGLLVRNARLTAELVERIRELSAQETELHASRRRLVVARDGARRRLADEITSTVRQGLAEIRADLPALRAEIERDPPRAASMLAAIQGEATRLIEHFRTIVHGVYPPVLRNHGLRAALDSLAASLPRPTEVSVADVGRFSSDIESGVYFCAASLARLRAGGDRPGVLRLDLLVEGDSLHFCLRERSATEPATIPVSELADVVDRLTALGGVLEIAESSPADGLVVHARLPITDADRVPVERIDPR